MIQHIIKPFKWLMIIGFIGHVYGEQVKQVATPVVNAAKAVVSLQVTQVNNDQIFNPFSDDPTFGFFFGRSMAGPRVVMGSGSGVIVDKNGLIVTCAHVINHAEKITVIMDTGREFDAKKLYENTEHDIAFIQIQDAENQEFPFVQMGDAHTLTITEPVYAIGNAFNMGQSVTSGIISATNRIVDDQFSLQTDAAVNPGNSGGGLFDGSGNYIGLPNAILTRTGANHGVGFAKPVNLIKSYMHRLQHKTLETPPWLGVNGQDFTYHLAKALPQFKASEYKGGVLITSIHSESPLAGKMQPKDIILSINDYPIYNMVMLRYMIDTCILGEDIKISLWRDGKI
ncbi:MAG: trypsin-like peptidase domain-containing protein, partial [Alphaproteobacteria bacterium]|nr:trypsin-like peptidase domain-containing protein [Alphaproteobacteria bacterium]